MIDLKLEENVELPKYHSDGASGFDVVCSSVLKVYKGDVEVAGDKLERLKKGFIDRGYLKIRPFERVLFSTGLRVANLPDSVELQVRSRSSVSLKRGLLIVTGTIDCDYRGIIGVAIYNSSPFLSTVTLGERIAQVVPSFVLRLNLVEKESITETKRGDGGFGSTNTPNT